MRKNRNMCWLRYQMRDTCWGLAYCCNKDCPYRNKALKRLGLTPKKYRKLKNLFDKILLEVVSFEKGGKI